MKRVLGLFAATALLTTGALALGGGSVGAAATSTPVVPIVQTIDLPAYPPKGDSAVFAVHGLNLDGQTAQTDGGTTVTVCAGGSPIDSNFEFGDIAGPLNLEIGAMLTIEVFLGADADCAGTDPVISQDVTVPDELAVALVATAGPDGELQLLPVVLDILPNETCFPSIEDPIIDQASSPQGGPVAPRAKLGAVHAANAGPVAVLVDGETADPSLAFGESLFADLPPGTYSVEVSLDGTPIVGPVDLPLDDCTLTVVYVVGNQPIAEEPTTTTTAPAPAAQAVAARPAFTG
jgi:hypothetical protein